MDGQQSIKTKKEIAIYFAQGIKLYFTKFKFVFILKQKL
jgi:hypothetical protein